MLANDVVDLAVLLGEGNTEVAFDEVAEVDEILFGEGFIEAVTGGEVGANGFTGAPLGRKRITRYS